VLLFGPEISANDAVAALERLTKVIRKEGLLVGREKANGDFLVETFGRKPKLVT